MQNINGKLNGKSTGTYAIYTESVCADYPQSNSPVLDSVDLTVPEGELVSLIGPNGAGKSTLFKLIVGLKTPSRGKLYVFGADIYSQRKNSVIAYVPQEGNIDWDYPITVKEVVATGVLAHWRSLGLKRFLYPQTHYHPVVKGALEDVEMLQYIDRPIGALSGGQKRRVFLARALAQDARLLLLDEPLAGVDSKSEAIILRVLQRLKQQGKTILMASHNLSATKTYSDRVILLNKTVINCGIPHQVMTPQWLTKTFEGSSLQLLSEGVL